MQETRQLTFTLFLLCTAFLVLANPINFLLIYYSFVDNQATPEGFCYVSPIKPILNILNTVACF